MTNRHLGTLAAAAVTLMAVAGCAGTDERRDIVDPNELVGTEWRVEDITRGGVIDDSNVTVGFPRKGRVAGSTGCNRYSGGVTIDEKEMSFGPLAGTRKACIPALGNQEVKFYAAMEDVHSWSVPDSGILHLADRRGAVVIRAHRIED